MRTAAQRGEPLVDFTVEAIDRAGLEAVVDVFDVHVADRHVVEAVVAEMPGEIRARVIRQRRIVQRWMHQRHSKSHLISRSNSEKSVGLLCAHPESATTGRELSGASPFWGGASGVVRR